MPPKKQAPKAQQYRADRDFNELRAGDVVEMEDDHPYLQTGYMQPVEEAAKADAARAEAAAESATGMSTTTVSESGASGANEGPAGAGPRPSAGSSS